jgi:hypothetical protein
VNDSDKPDPGDRNPPDAAERRRASSNPLARAAFVVLLITETTVAIGAVTKGNSRLLVAVPVVFVAALLVYLIGRYQPGPQIKKTILAQVKVLSWVAALLIAICAIVVAIWALAPLICEVEQQLFAAGPRDPTPDALPRTDSSPMPAKKEQTAAEVCLEARNLLNLPDDRYLKCLDWAETIIGFKACVQAATERPMYLGCEIKHAPTQTASGSF